ncbi:MAG: NAD(P)/FAD-dependent oxidoreductase [Steroidobacteraceae bacterium]
MKRRGDPDVVIVGGGHNGLVAACYLARAGLAVTVLERRAILGGASVTEEFHPGFRNSTAAYTVSLLQPKVIRDLRLAEHGLRILPRPMSNFLPLANGDGLGVGPDLASTQREVARFSTRDAARLPAFSAMLERLADVLRGLVLRTPPNVGGGWRDALEALSFGRTLRGLDMEARRDLYALFTRSAADLLDQWFESEGIKAAFGFDAVVGNFAGPYQPGTGYVLLHHQFGEVNGVRGVWGHAVGGMGAVSDAIAAEARRLGVELRTGCEVARIEVRAGRVRAAVLADGSEVRARCIAANLNPKLLYLKLLDAADLPPEIPERMRAFRCISGTFRMNVALGALPRFSCRPEPGPHLGAGIIMAPSLAYMERAYSDARNEGMSRAPVVEMLLPSTVDDTLAPRGQHVASLFCQQFDPALDWPARREAAVQRIFDVVESHAPGFRASVLGYEALSPYDLEQRFGLVGGDIGHGALGLDQLWAARPLLGLAAYRGAVAGLYHCGAGAHPGSGVTGAAGHNCARELLRDLGRRFK